MIANAFAPANLLDLTTKVLQWPHIHACKLVHASRAKEQQRFLNWFDQFTPGHVIAQENESTSGLPVVLQGDHGRMLGLLTAKNNEALKTWYGNFELVDGLLAGRHSTAYAFALETYTVSEEDAEILAFLNKSKLLKDSWELQNRCQRGDGWPVGYWLHSPRRRFSRNPTSLDFHMLAQVRMDINQRFHLAVECLRAGLVDQACSLGREARDRFFDNFPIFNKFYRECCISKYDWMGEFWLIKANWNVITPNLGKKNEDQFSAICTPPENLPDQFSSSSSIVQPIHGLDEWYLDSALERVQP